MEGEREGRKDIKETEKKENMSLEESLFSNGQIQNFIYAYLLKIIIVFF